MPSLVAWIHIVQVLLVTIAIGITAYKVFIIKNAPPGRASTFVFSVGAKSLIVIAYQVLSKKYNKWFSLKANMILNCMETVFWAAVCFLGIQQNMKSCSGIHCTLSWVVIVLGAIIGMVTGFGAIVSIRIFRAAKVARLAADGKEAHEMGSAPYSRV